MKVHIYFMYYFSVRYYPALCFKIKYIVAILVAA